jgi:hypothetical protein
MPSSARLDRLNRFNRLQGASTPYRGQTPPPVTGLGAITARCSGPLPFAAPHRGASRPRKCSAQPTLTAAPGRPAAYLIMSNSTTTGLGIHASSIGVGLPARSRPRQSRCGIVARPTSASSASVSIQSRTHRPHADLRRTPPGPCALRVRPHYHRQRSPRGKQRTPPAPVRPIPTGEPSDIVRRRIVGGLINEYNVAA